MRVCECVCAIGTALDTLEIHTRTHTQSHNTLEIHTRTYKHTQSHTFSLALAHSHDTLIQLIFLSRTYKQHTIPTQYTHTHEHTHTLSLFLSRAHTFSLFRSQSHAHSHTNTYSRGEHQDPFHECLVELRFERSVTFYRTRPIFLIRIDQ